VPGNQHEEKGFTLAELLVATTILAIVMTAIYTAFSTSIRMWQIGSSDLNVYQEARSAMTIMNRELNSVVTGANHLFQGDNDEVEFYCVVPPLNAEDGPDPRIMWVKYERQRASGREPAKLVRYEAEVESPLPLEPTENEQEQEGDSFGEDPGLVGIDLGRDTKFELVHNVEDFEMTYWWIPPPEDRATIDGQTVELEREPVQLDKNREGWGRPQGMKIVLTVVDPYSEEGEKTFTTFLAFRGETTQYDEDELGIVSRSF